VDRSRHRVPGMHILLVRTFHADEVEAGAKSFGRGRCERRLSAAGRPEEQRTAGQPRGWHEGIERRVPWQYPRGRAQDRKGYGAGVCV